MQNLVQAFVKARSKRGQSLLHSNKVSLLNAKPIIIKKNKQTNKQLSTVAVR